MDGDVCCIGYGYILSLDPACLFYKRDHQRELMSSFQLWITSLSPVRYIIMASSTTRSTIDIGVATKEDC
jgi:hypothetical protein